MRSPALTETLLLVQLPVVLLLEIVTDALEAVLPLTQSDTVQLFPLPGEQLR